MTHNVSECINLSEFNIFLNTSIYRSIPCKSMFKFHDNLKVID